MWPFGGATLVLFGLLPSVWHWLAPGRADSLWHTACFYSFIDGVFVIGALLFLHIATLYGETRSRDRSAPYPGAWIEHDGRQQAPRGFAPGYLGLAFVVSFIIPAAVLLLSHSSSRALAFATLGPYLLVFIPQIALETKYLNRSIMTPALPVLFMYYRLWQFIRSLQLVATHHRLETQSLAGAGQHWLTTYLLSLLVFWIFDTGCTTLWLPWMYDWQLQDPQHLEQLVQIRAQQQQQQQQQAAKRRHPAGAEQHAAEGGASTPGGSSHRMVTRSRTRTPAASADTAPASGGTKRHRRNANSADIDSYGFGS